MKNDANNKKSNNNWLTPPNPTLYYTFDTLTAWYHTGCEGKPIYFKLLKKYDAESNNRGDMKDDE